MSYHDRVRREYVKTGPRDKSLLRLQPIHRSNAIWHGQVDDTPLTCKRIARSVLRGAPDERIVPYLRSTGFYGVAMIGYCPLDWHLITALVERWRPETHTFHLPVGECGISLQDIAVLSGLPIHGEAVIGRTNMDWEALCLRLLGRVPIGESRRGCRLKISWLSENFSEIPEEPDIETIQQHARAYILRLIGGVVFPNKSGVFVHLMFLSLLEDMSRLYSWGGACLAWLYREMCKATDPKAMQIGGPLIFLQLWAWDRIQIVAPEIRVPEIIRGVPYGCRWSAPLQHTDITSHALIHLRYSLDRMTPDDFRWEPYPDHVLQHLPDYCLQGRDIWSACVPLLCFHLIEWHHTDRFMRQFGFTQPKPDPPRQTDDLHETDLRQSSTNWEIRHGWWINVWNNRAQYVLRGERLGLPLHHHSEYMEWYRGVSCRWISPLGATFGAVEDGLEYLKITTAQSGDIASARLVQSITHAIQEDRRDSPTIRPQPAPPATNVGDENDEGPQPSNQSRRPRRQGRRQTLKEPENLPDPPYGRIPYPMSHYPLFDDCPPSSSYRPQQQHDFTPQQQHDFTPHPEEMQTPVGHFSHPQSSAFMTFRDFAPSPGVEVRPPTFSNLGIFSHTHVEGSTSRQDQPGPLSSRHHHAAPSSSRQHHAAPSSSRQHQHVPMFETEDVAEPQWNRRGRGRLRDLAHVQRPRRCGTGGHYDHH